MRQRKLGRGIVLVLFGVSSAVAQVWQTDQSFAPVLEQGGPLNGIVGAVALPGGSVLASAPYVNGVKTRGRMRITSDGTVDPTFAIPADFFNYDVSYVYPDGRLLVCVDASYPEAGHLYRLNANGSIDPSFHPTEHDASNSTLGRPKAAIQPDGKILVWGSFTTMGGKSRFGLARLSSEGVLDETFVAPFEQGNTGWIGDVDLQLDGKILVAGAILDCGVVRLNSNGSRDFTFDATGSWGGISARWVRVLSNGTILTTSQFGGGKITRLLATGANDVTVWKCLVQLRPGEFTSSSRRELS
jgi:uncharacterized delta-60 repeat protein